MRTMITKVASAVLVFCACFMLVRSEFKINSAIISTCDEYSWDCYKEYKSVSVYNDEIRFDGRRGFYMYVYVTVPDENSKLIAWL